ncbi:MAG: glycosyltransferase family 4 protein [Pirellulaceae bacterium]
MVSNALKVVWLCTFSDAEKRSHLRLWRPGRNEYGQWIPNLLRAFEMDGTLDLHVVSTDHLMVKTVQSWKARNITYHCFKSGTPFLGRGWPLGVPVDQMTGFWLNRRRIKRIVDHVRPDLIHLFGVENPHYGAAALDLLEKYPILVTIQGFIHRESHYDDTFRTRVRCRYEEALLRACQVYSGDYESETVVRRFNPDVTYRHIYFPVNESLVSSTPLEKEQPYELLFVGRLTQQKGFGDFLEIVRRLAEVRPGLVAAVVGDSREYQPAMDLIVENRLENNICWISRFGSQEGLFRVFRQSKLFLAPTYNDCFPSTIRESMMLGTPVIAYATGGIPWANRDGRRNIVVVPQGDLGGIANAALDLLGDAQARGEMAKRAQLFANQEFSLKTNVEVIRKTYQEIVGSR